ncbi:MAG: thioredoxin domain-containing protein, partial [Planctomycetes bacterium]|nr:thioredoxin domain-containing protein [Planctomycetota bacterium]
AALMNEHFVNIKVDREERPDVDDLYMRALHRYYAATGAGRGGGWPLSMFLTPEGKPFFGGTYFPARDGDREGITGFFTLVKKIHDVWKDSPEKIRADAETLTKMLKSEMEPQPASLTPLDAKLVEGVQTELAEQFDPKYGGFGYSRFNPRQPKFPEPSNLVYLLMRARDESLEEATREEARNMLVTTLDHMARGGIRDHICGGFHRYSVDRFWRIPHFEKMLYDNAQLASVYAEGYRLTGREDFRRTAEELLNFVLREMTSPEGGFYSALDADSEGEEGKFYRWTKAEVEQALSKEEFELFADVYGLDEPPNFEDEHGEFYVPQLDAPLAEIAEARGMTEAKLEAKLDPIRRKLFDVRSRRVRPMTDTKILTSWNGLMIRGLADAGYALENDRYLDAARRAARFVLENLQTDKGRLLRTYSDGRAKLNAYLDDYAFLVDGLLALHGATGEEEWLAAALRLTEKQLELFQDERGGFYFTSDDHESLLARGKNPADGALPSGASVTVGNLIKLASHNPEYREIAEQAARVAAAHLERSPALAPRMAVHIQELLLL